MPNAATESGKHVEALREHLAYAQGVVNRLSHALLNATSQAAVIPGCEHWSPQLEAAEQLARQIEGLIVRLNIDDAIAFHRHQDDAP